MPFLHWFYLLFIIFICHTMTIKLIYVALNSPTSLQSPISRLEWFPTMTKVLLVWYEKLVFFIVIIFTLSYEFKHTLCTCANLPAWIFYIKYNVPYLFNTCSKSNNSYLFCIQLLHNDCTYKTSRLVRIKKLIRLPLLIYLT